MHRDIMLPSAKRRRHVNQSCAPALIEVASVRCVPILFSAISYRRRENHAALFILLIDNQM